MPVPQFRGGVVLQNCLRRCYLLLAQGTFCGFSQEVCRYYYLILMFYQLSFQKVRSFSRRERNFGLRLSAGLQHLPLFYIIDGASVLGYMMCIHNQHPKWLIFEDRVSVLGYVSCPHIQHSYLRVGPWIMDSK